MRPPKEFVDDVYYTGLFRSTRAEWTRAIEARDREIATATLRKAAEWFSRRGMMSAVFVIGALETMTDNLERGE